MRPNLITIKRWGGGWVAIPHFRKWLRFCPLSLKWRWNADCLFFCFHYFSIWLLCVVLFVSIELRGVIGKGAKGSLRWGEGGMDIQSLPQFVYILFIDCVDTRESVPLLSCAQLVWGE